MAAGMGRAHGRRDGEGTRPQAWGGHMAVRAPHEKVPGLQLGRARHAAWGGIGHSTGIGREVSGEESTPHLGVAQSMPFHSPMRCIQRRPCNIDGVYTAPEGIQ